MFQFKSEDFRVKVGLAEMLKGGVIMDVTNAEQAKIAEDAGASAVMALERVPSDIRKEGGVARMASISKMEEIMRTVSIPVMAKARIGHFMEARVLEALDRRAIPRFGRPFVGVALVVFELVLPEVMKPYELGERDARSPPPLRQQRCPEAPIRRSLDGACTCVH